MIDNKRLTRSMAIELENAINILAPAGECGSENERINRINRLIENLKYRSIVGATSPDISIDAVFELVRKYQSADELNEYCARCVYFNAEERADIYKDEIIIRAEDLIERIKWSMDDCEYKLKNAITHLKFNDEYKELKRIVNEIKNSTTIKEIIENKIANMESEKIKNEALITECKKKFTKIFEGKDADLVNGEMPPAVQLFVNQIFPNKKKSWRSNLEM